MKIPRLLKFTIVGVEPGELGSSPGNVAPSRCVEIFFSMSWHDLHEIPRSPFPLTPQTLWRWAVLQPARPSYQSRYLTQFGLCGSVAGGNERTIFVCSSGVCCPLAVDHGAIAEQNRPNDIKRGERGACQSRSNQRWNPHSFSPCGSFSSTLTSILDDLLPVTYVAGIRSRGQQRANSILPCIYEGESHQFGCQCIVLFGRRSPAARGEGGQTSSLRAHSIVATILCEKSAMTFAAFTWTRQVCAKIRGRTTDAELFCLHIWHQNHLLFRTRRAH